MQTVEGGLAEHGDTVRDGVGNPAAEAVHRDQFVCVVVDQNAGHGVQALLLLILGVRVGCVDAVQRGDAV